MFIPVEPRNIPQPIQAVSTIQMLPLGSVVKAHDPIHGECEFIYLAGAASTVAGDYGTWNASGTFVRGSLAANAGVPMCWAVAPCVAGEYGFFAIAGVAYANNNATAAVDSAAFHVAAAATISSTAVAGRQILGGVIRSANNSTFTKGCTTRNGSNRLFVPDMSGLFVGMGVSGTGIPGGTTLSAGVDKSPNADSQSAGSSGSILLSANATADGTVTVTFTRTNASLLLINRPNAQPQIT